MANLIKCPTCGENNPAGQEFCQNCRSPLNPSTGTNQTIKPGQAPTNKITSDLEPVLPQWLKDARESARESYQEEPSKPATTSQSSPSVFASSDLLAGLQSQSQDDEEDIPDWLANITGQEPKPPERPQASSEVRWVEFGGSKDFTQPIPTPTPEPDPELPSWMSTPPAEENAEKDELSDWLRAADASQAAQPFSFDAPADASSSPPAETPDWLRSMVSDNQAAFDDSGSNADETFITSDTPDWLRGLESSESSGGSSSAPAFTDAPDWLKAMDAEKAAPQADFSPDASSDTPDWLSAMDGEQDASSDSPDWLKAMDAEKAAPQADFSAADSSDTPDWLKSMGGEQAAPSDTPDWLKAMDAEKAAPQADFSSADSSDTPDWLSAMGGEQAAASDTPDWLKSMDAEKAAPLADFSAAALSDTPDWLKAMGDQEKAQGADAASFSEKGPGDDVFSSAGKEADWLQGPESGTQDWLKDIQSTTEEKPASAQLSSEEDSGDLPDWLKAAAPQSSIYAEPSAAQSESLSAAPSSDMPDWFKTAEPAKAQEAQPATPLADFVPPASSKDSQAGADSDSLFTELPDWLSVVDHTTLPDSVPSAITNVDAIAPGELPSWVQAMRPVDAGIPQAAAALSADKSLETRGALAGLQGVLPAAPGYAATSKPKAYSIRLQASEEQLSHAALLEQIISAETSPVPIGSFAAPGTSRALRWSLVFLFFVILPVVLFLRTQIFVLPDSVMVPLEVGGAVNVIQSIPQDAPVLTIFDYEPSRAGEVETVAVPVLDQLLLKRARLTFISTKETGVVLAERLISTGYLAGHEQVQYLNMGYLPGGQLGIRAFAENPVAAMPYVFTQTSLIDFSSVDPWVTPPLAGVTSLPQFSALILVTDDADSARAWIEQTQSVRNATPVPFVVISSAQAAPMLQPYYASGQISGLVSGLYGGALFEQRNNQNPGTARLYWDAYSIGILAAVALILIGGLVSLALNLRDRAMREAK